MERKLILRNAVSSARVSPSTFDVDDFAQRLQLGARGDQMVLAEVVITEWDSVRLQVLPDRLQLGFKESADGTLVKRVTEEFLARTDNLASGEPIEFNAALLLELEEGDADPSHGLVDAPALAKSLGGTGGRGGVTLVYDDSLSRWWIELSPQPGRERSWVFDFNRYFEKIPNIGDDRTSILDWFADVEARLLAQFETISLERDR